MLQLFTINDDFIDYLRKFDSKVLSNKQGKRPYVGVVCVINDSKYYVPLMSPKPKHMTMSNTKDFHKISGGKYGAINFNNMLPVIDEVLSEIITSKEPDRNYRLLLQNQYLELLRIQDILEKKVKAIYSLFLTDSLTKNDERIKARCCDFLLLEEKVKDYAR